MASVETRKAASEGGHFYDRNGLQVESVPSADGKRQIKPDIRHARKHDLAPGVTTIIGCAHREDLVRWQIDQGILAALNTPREPGENDLDFMSRLRDEGKKKARDAADKGTAIHAAIQRWFEGDIPAEEFLPNVQAAQRALNMTCGPRKWHTERGCVSAYGFGTKADLSSDDRQWVLDIKSKDGDEAALRSLSIYESYQMQLAATADALNTPKAAMGILYVSRTHPDAAVLLVATPEQIEKGWAMFRALLRYWQIKQSHRPSWATKEA